MVFLPFNALMLALTAPLANQGISANHFNVAGRASQALGHGVPLRIMPLGASITYGLLSSDGNGYRQALRTQVVSGPGNPVRMVGSRQAGSMRDNGVEGWSGYRIEQVHTVAMTNASVPRWKPNVVLINAGTNDATQNFKLDSAGQRMEALIRDVWAASPRAVVVLSTLLVNKNADVERRTGVINRQFREVAQKLRDEGRRLVLVDMHEDPGPGTGDLADHTHPNDVGYRRMANVWFPGLIVASDAGWLQAPEPVTGLPDNRVP